jgi:hypothetical protein
MGVFRENVVPVFHNRVTTEPTLGIVALRRLIRSGTGGESIGCGVIVEYRIAPSAAVREPRRIRVESHGGPRDRDRAIKERNE